MLLLYVYTLVVGRIQRYIGIEILLFDFHYIKYEKFNFKLFFYLIGNQITKKKLELCATSDMFDRYEMGLTTDFRVPYSFIAPLVFFFFCLKTHKKIIFINKFNFMKGHPYGIISLFPNNHS